jgi:beta-mannanase
MEDIEEEVPMTAQYTLQQNENIILQNEYIGINHTDDDDEHLIAMGSINPEDIYMIAHQAAHIQSKIDKSQIQPVEQGNQMLNGAMSQAMSQAGSQTAKLNSNQ